MISRKEFLKWHPLAYKGNYQDQRNVALSTGCEDAVRTDDIAGCAWRIVLKAARAPRMPVAPMPTWLRD